jgi:glyoxylase-like metal-dependent hydrolase (beta-lactamase superfamily II)
MTASRRYTPRGRVQLWEGSHTIDANLRLEAAPGHAPGSSVVKLASGGDRALLAGDILHTPLQVMYPDYSSCFCQDPAEARTTRRRLLGWAADVHALVLPAHISGHSAFEVEDRGDGSRVRAGRLSNSTDRCSSRPRTPGSPRAAASSSWTAAG